MNYLALALAVAAGKQEVIPYAHYASGTQTSVLIGWFLWHLANQTVLYRTFGETVESENKARKEDNPRSEDKGAHLDYFIWSTVN